MGWSGSLTSDSELGTSITYTPDNAESTSPTTNWVNAATYAGNYSVDSFTAPRRGIYQFILKGSGGVTVSVNDPDTAAREGGASGGTGGTTTGYLLLEGGQTVYVGAGGVCRAAFVSAVTGSSLAAITASNLYFVAGAGGSGGAYDDGKNYTGYNCKVAAGGNGGGSSGAGGEITGNPYIASEGGTQTAGGAGGSANGYSEASGTYGIGGNGGSGSSPSNGKYKARCGRGGDGYYGGGGGAGEANDNGIIACGGAGGSGYVKTSSFTHANVTYTSTTSQGSGATANNAGSVTVTYYALGELPIVYNGTKITELIYNGTKVTSVIYNGTKLF